MAVLAASAFAGPPTVTVDQLAKPPGDARHYTLLSKAGRHGHSETWTLADGTLMARDSLVLRGQVIELESATKIGADGMESSVKIRGFDPTGDAAESFEIVKGTASWKSQVDAGSAPYAAPAYYVPASSSITLMQPFVKALLASPDKSLALLPGGRAKIERLTELTVGEGEHKVRLVCWGISGLGTSPMPLWATEDGRFWGAVGGLALLPEGYEGALEMLTRAQDDALAARSPAVAHALPKTPAGAVAFTHVRAFVDGTRFADDQTIVVDKGTIVAVGPASSTRVPEGAQVFEGAGRTLVPGLWDSHMHVSDDFSGPLLLSLGITSARDPGNDDELTLARAKRRAAGDLLMPHVYPSSLIDGKGPNTAQVANVATSLDETLALVRRAKANGFTGVKFYGTLDPAWVAPAAAEAHRLGLHVHGHLPAGMRTSDAIKAGYDEVTHIYFIMMEAMPDDVVRNSNGMGRFEGTGRYARKVDLDADPIKSLIALMRERHTAADPTLVVAENIFVPENGDLSPACAPFAGTLPPATERGFRSGGFTVPADLTRADFRASFAKLVALVGAMHNAGVRVVAGTDGTGMELVRELELYLQAGFTNEEALAAATIEPARNVGKDGMTGSIAVGKAADLVLVEGDPSRRIGDLRNTRVVMMDGKLMDADALRTAAGFSGRPHPAR
jgi:imidazolonepropionase-like amidohydrolase